MLPEPAPDKALPARSAIVAAPLATSNPRVPAPVPVLTVTTNDAAAVVLPGATDAIDATQEDVVETVRRLTGGKLVDFCVEAVGRPEALATAPRLLRRQGRLYVFGVPHHDQQQFPWFAAVINEIEIISSMGPECREYFQTAIDMVAQGRVDLTAMVTPRMPWEQAAKAFEMYADPGHAEDSLKLTLLL